MDLNDCLQADFEKKLLFEMDFAKKLPAAAGQMDSKQCPRARLLERLCAAVEVVDDTPALNFGPNSAAAELVGAAFDEILAAQVYQRLILSPLPLA